MFEDKELLNTILYTKRHSTYWICGIAIIVGIGLCFIRVSDKTVLNAYKDLYKNDIVWSNKNIEKIVLSNENGQEYLTNKSDKNIIGVTVGDDFYKVKVEKNNKVKVDFKGKISGCVYE